MLLLPTGSIPKNIIHHLNPEQSRILHEYIDENPIPLPPSTTTAHHGRPTPLPHPRHGLGQRLQLPGVGAYPPFLPRSRLTGLDSLIDAIAADTIPNSRIVRLIVNRSKAYATTRAEQAGMRLLS